MEALEFPYKTKPFEHQRFVFEDSRDKEYAGFLMEMGCGKSKPLLDTAAYLFAKGEIDTLVIVARAGVYTNWLHVQIPTHLTDEIPYVVFMYESYASKAQLEQRDMVDKPMPGILKIFLVNLEAIRNERTMKLVGRVVARGKTLMAVDEATDIANTNSVQSKACYKIGKFAKYRRILVGDIVADSPLDVFGQCHFLKPGALGFRTFTEYRANYAKMGVAYGPGGRQFPVVEGFHMLDDLNRRLKEFCYIIKKDDCLDLPEKMPSVPIYVDMVKDQREAYQQMQYESYVEILKTIKGLDPQTVCLQFEEDGQPANEETELVGIAAELAITRSIKLHQIACGFILDEHRMVHAFKSNPRLEALVDHVRDLKKVVIWTHYTECIINVIEALQQQYGKGSVVHFYGKTPKDQREYAKKAFQDPGSGVRFFVGNQQAAGMGIDLWAASHAVYYSNSYARIQRVQSEDRIHRIGQTKACSYYDLCCRGTVDEKVVQALAMKEDVARQVTKSGWAEMFRLAA